MVNSIQSSGINPIQMFNATNAFKASSRLLEEQNVAEISDGLQVNESSSILEQQNLQEIREYAKIAGEQDLSNDDIQYGVTYGRSVIADYVI